MASFNFSLCYIQFKSECFRKIYSTLTGICFLKHVNIYLLRLCVRSVSHSAVINRNMFRFIFPSTLLSPSLIFYLLAPTFDQRGAASWSLWWCDWGFKFAVVPRMPLNHWWGFTAGVVDYFRVCFLSGERKPGSKCLGGVSGLRLHLSLRWKHWRGFSLQEVQGFMTPARGKPPTSCLTSAPSRRTPSHTAHRSVHFTHQPLLLLSGPSSSAVS